MPQLTRHQRVSGGLLGLLVGDALGVPYEFHPPERLPPRDLIAMTPPRGFPRAHVGVPPGTWSDDGAHALILLDSLLSRGDLDLEHLGQGLRQWLFQGRFAVNQSVFDVGAQTSSAINRLMMGIPADQAGPADERHNGNGSLMRVLPLALWHHGSDADLARLAARQSLVTHGHARSQACCALYCLWARAELRGDPGAWNLAVESLQRLADDAGLPPDEVEKVADPSNAGAAGGSGYVLDTLWSAKVAVDGSECYEDAVLGAIEFGHDTDTTAAVAGGIAGLRFGLQGIPMHWLDALRGGSVCMPLLRTLHAHLAQASYGSGLDRELIEAFFDTEFVSSLPSGPLVFKIGDRSRDIASSLAAHRMTSGAFITAANPYSEPLPEDVNAARNAVLRQDLIDLGAALFDGVGRSPDGTWAEPSVLCFGVSREAANGLADRHGQNAYVFIEEDGSCELVLRR